MITNGFYHLKKVEIVNYKKAKHKKWLTGL